MCQYANLQMFASLLFPALQDKYNRTTTEQQPNNNRTTTEQQPNNY